ncbi:hypothetical protein HMPREF0994_07291, partial [Lachnospiraceae bacterium 3_1_57FAA_CT1]
FQSTKPQRLRHGAPGQERRPKKFQSTKPQRLRLYDVVSIHQVFRISIHEAAKASTQDYLLSVIIHSGFQSTKPQRLRRVFICQCCQSIYFNPRSRKGFDLLGCKKQVWFANFNPRSRKGFDMYATNQADAYEISIHEAAKASTY